ncbi:MAG: 6-bladed beta-propeller [Gemmatimonadales bacterium]
MLQETDTTFLGRVPHTYTVDSAGRIYVIDQTTDRVLVFAPTGDLHLTLGKHGGGPGEFQRIGPLTIPHDGLLLQGARGNKLTLLDLASGAELNRFHHAGYLASWAVSPNWLILGLYNPAESAAVVVISWDSIRSAPSGARLVASMGSLPELYRTYPGVEVFNQVVVGQRADTLLLGFGAADFIVRVPLAGGPPDTVQVPRRARRPVTRASLAKFTTTALPFHDALSGLPNLLGIWPMSDGHVALWFQEASTEDPRRNNAEIIGHGRIAVLNPSLSQACVDARIEAPGTGRTRLAFSRDTLYSLDQLLEPDGAGSSVRTVVRKYAIDLRGCRWLPTRARPGY